MLASVLVLGLAELAIGEELAALPALDPPLLLPQAAAPSIRVAAATAVNAVRAFMVMCSLFLGEDFM
jgi:hypothetical protein